MRQIIQTKLFIKFFLSSCFLTVAFGHAAFAKDFVSGSRATDILELYTSEGCSSCPPADRWFSTLKQRGDVFKNFIPMAFHVDYWNRLGWKDRFSSAEFSARQRSHVMSGHASQAYTPQLVVNAQEWRGWGRQDWQASQRHVGVLKASINDDSRLMNVVFNPASNEILGGGLLSEFLPEGAHQVVLNVAMLGMGLNTQVKAGENHGLHLKHDFVVLNHVQQPVQSSLKQWQLVMPAIPQQGQQQTAVVVWLSDYLTQEVVQAVGGYL